MERGFKYRIYPNACQREQIARTLGCCRFVYNRALDVKKSAYTKTGKTVSWAELSRMLPVWKRDPETSWLAQVDSMALQQSIRDLDRAYKNFFRRVRCGRGKEDGVKLHVDHIVPVSRSGKSVMGNLQTLCEDCNCGKGNRYEE